MDLVGYARSLPDFMILAGPYSRRFYSRAAERRNVTVAGTELGKDILATFVIVSACSDTQIDEVGPGIPTLMHLSILNVSYPAVHPGSSSVLSSRLVARANIEASWRGCFDVAMDSRLQLVCVFV